MAFSFSNVSRSIPQRKPRLRVTAKLIDLDKGFREIIQKISKLNGQGVVAGVLVPAAFARNRRTGEKLGKIAAINEFGEGTTPERSYLRATFDTKNRIWFNNIKRFMETQPIRTAFDRKVIVFSGKIMKKDIKLAISQKTQPPNALRTVRRKGFNDPLVEWGTLHNSISFKLTRTVKI